MGGAPIDDTAVGSTGGTHLNEPIVGMAAMPTSGGVTGSAPRMEGCSIAGDAPFDGSTVGTGLGQVVDMASDGGPTVHDLRHSRHLPGPRLAHQPCDAPHSALGRPLTYRPRKGGTP
jgi:hypothetical protein